MSTIVSLVFLALAISLTVVCVMLLATLKADY